MVSSPCSWSPGCPSWAAPGWQRGSSSWRKKSSFTVLQRAFPAEPRMVLTNSKARAVQSSSPGIMIAVTRGSKHPVRYLVYKQEPNWFAQKMHWLGVEHKKIANIYQFCPIYHRSCFCCYSNNCKSQSGPGSIRCYRDMSEDTVIDLK